ncbi:hypothetical protein D9M68_722500 [compost metagenome]
MVAIAPDIGQIDAERHVGHRIHHGLQRVQRGGHARQQGQIAAGFLQHFRTAVQIGQQLQGLQRLGAHAGRARRQFDQAGNVLFAHQEDDLFRQRGQGGVRLQDGAEHAGMAKIQPRIAHAGDGHRFQHELDDFQVGLRAGMAVDLGADLQQLAAGQQIRRTGMQHVAAIAQAGDARAVQQVRVDARDLRSHVSAHAQRAAGQLVDQFARTQIQIAAGTGQQRIDVFDQGRRDQFEAVRAVQIEKFAAQFLDAPGLCRKYVGKALGQQPVTHEYLPE